jgi:hypothetical protein
MLLYLDFGGSCLHLGLYTYPRNINHRRKQASVDQDQSAPIPSAALSSNPDAHPPGSAAKKENIKCFKCSRDGHYQSGCQFPAHCSRCDEDGHTPPCARCH